MLATRQLAADGREQSEIPNAPSAINCLLIDLPDAESRDPIKAHRPRRQ